tara:strand:+ start:2071 stop:2565 length:495 start_codon:yes stop_codon:yes gene_type:complete
MTYTKTFIKSSVKSDILNSKAAADISGTTTAHFDKTLLSDTNVSCSNDYQFVLSASSGSSFILEGGLVISSSSSANSIFQFYDETNGQFIGFKGSLATKIDPVQRDPWYNTLATALILSSDFGGSDITVSLRVVSDSGSPTYPASVSYTNATRTRQAVLRILQT